MILEALLCPLLVLGTALGLARPLARRLRFGALDELLAGGALSLVLVWGIGWGLYVCGAPPAAWRVIPVLAAAGLLADRRGIAGLLRDPDVRQAVAGQLIVMAWCLSLLPFIRSYSGGGWAGDWYEHWERTVYFIHHGAADYRFLEVYPLAARPPLANLVCAVFLADSGPPDYPRYQVLMAVLSSLAYLPAAAIARRLGGPRAPAVLAVLLAASPLFVTNATFPWTKLPSAAFVLTGAYFMLLPALPVRIPADQRSRAAVVGSVTLAAGMIAHYSAGPYLVVLGVVQAVWLLRHRSDRGLRQATLAGWAAAALVAATWFAWAAAVYGPRTLVTSTTSITQLGSWHGNQAVKILLNIRDTLIPHFLRRFDRSLLAQRNPWSAARDWFFSCYQLNLPLAFGSVGFLALARELVQASRRASRSEARGWAAGLAALVVLGIAVHGERSTWGLAHICLQPLVLAGLAFLAAHWDGLGRGWRIALIVGGAFDFAAGIVLPLAVQDLALGARPGAPAAAVIYTYSWPAWANYGAKTMHSLDFVADRVGFPLCMGLALPAAILILALQRARTQLPETPHP